MNFPVADTRFDLAVVASPRLDVWPSAGVRELTSMCSRAGLKVGLFGGEGLSVKGVIPLPETGGIVVAQDVQGRIHRIQARAVVRISAFNGLPDPFPGWRSPGLVPLSTAIRLKRETQVRWDPTTVILGSGNRAFRFGSELLDSGVSEVFCLETFAQWGAKRFAGWEVEKRRFEMSGGKLIEGRPLSLTPKASLIWQLRVQDGKGVRLLEVSRVVGAGPYRVLPEMREYPPGSLLFEIEQTAPQQQEEDVQGWVSEVERAHVASGKIIRALKTDFVSGEEREKVEQIQRRARSRLKRYRKHLEEPFVPAYQGKWMAAMDARKIRAFTGTPRTAQLTKPIASIECIEEIPCGICTTKCPEGAIDLGRVPRGEISALSELKCTGCGICLQSCPSSAISMFHEKENRPTSNLTVYWKGLKPWSSGEFAVLLNRRGESMGSGRVVKTDSEKSPQLVELEIPVHLVWEARGIRRGRTSATEDELYLQAVARSESREDKIEVTLNGERQFVRDNIPISAALFEAGHARPEDVLYCRDGSCGLCEILVDGAKKAACQSRTHRGMAIRLDQTERPLSQSPPLCTCQETSREEVVERVAQGNLRSVEAVVSVCKVGQGVCHGQLCMEPFRWSLLDLGIEAEQWIDWRFPWSEWKLSRS